jgi:hypothetical protein
MAKLYLFVHSVNSYSNIIDLKNNVINKTYFYSISNYRRYLSINEVEKEYSLKLYIKYEQILNNNDKLIKYYLIESLITS